MILIHPFAKPLVKGGENPKNYPYWEELVYELQKTKHVVQIGLEGEKQLVEDFRKGLTMPQLRQLIKECETWIGIDSFFQHLAWSEGKPGIVLWSVSDPNIFGHPENINLLKDRKYLTSNQFLWWDFTPHNPDAFVKPQEVLNFT
jgi:ADP-heptose:LPS heptosyltransferase